MTRIFDEKFEATGYDETGWSETVGSGGTIDEDADTADVSSPTAWEDQCCKIIVANTATYTKNSIGSYPILYWRIEFIITSESLANNTNAPFFSLRNNAESASALIFYLDKDAAGALSFLGRFNHTGALSGYTAFVTPELDTRYRIEVKWDATNDLWSWKINGTVQPNNVDSTDPVTSEGTLTSTHPTDVGTIILGTGATSKNYTCYHDLVATDDADWVGEDGDASLSPNDSISISDSIILNIQVVKSDSISLSDSLLKTFNITKSDSVVLSDLITKQFSLNKSDIVNLSDELLKKVDIVLNDNVNLFDNFGAIITLILALNDSISMSDSISKTQNITKSDAINISDEIIKSFGLSESDTIALSDIISKSIATTRSDTINITDNFSSLIILILALNDTINLSDDISKEIDLVKSDIINLSDEITKLFGLTKSDIINLADGFSTSADVIYALLNFIAKNKTFNFNAKSKIFNFIAKNKTFNFNAKSRGTE